MPLYANSGRLLYHHVVMFSYWTQYILGLSLTCTIWIEIWWKTFRADMMGVKFMSHNKVIPLNVYWLWVIFSVHGKYGKVKSVMALEILRLFRSSKSPLQDISLLIRSCSQGIWSQLFDHSPGKIIRAFTCNQKNKKLTVQNWQYLDLTQSSWSLIVHHPVCKYVNPTSALERYLHLCKLEQN